MGAGNAVERGDNVTRTPASCGTLRVHDRDPGVRLACGFVGPGECAGGAGARAYYDQLRARGIEHDPALRQLANRLVGILHGCLKTRTLYDEATAWPQNDSQYPPVA